MQWAESPKSMCPMALGTASLPYLSLMESRGSTLLPAACTCCVSTAYASRQV